MSARSLLIHDPDGSTRVFELTKSIVKIGRTYENDVILVGNRISRSHAPSERMPATSRIPLDQKPSLSRSKRCRLSSTSSSRGLNWFNSPGAQRSFDRSRSSMRSA